MSLRSQSGLSLLELVVAIWVLTIAGGALFYLASTTVSATTTSKDHASAMHLAVAKLEELKGTPFDDLASDADTGTITAGGASGGIFERSWTVSDRTIGGVASKDVTVTVEWAGGGGVTLSTNVVQPSIVIPTYLEAFPTASIRSWTQTK